MLLGDAEHEAEVDLPGRSRSRPRSSAPPGPPRGPGPEAVDALLFVALAAVVLYFTGRAARVDLGVLVASWRWLAAYLGLLALFYAGYFTGTTGQTPASS